MKTFEITFCLLLTAMVVASCSDTLNPLPVAGGWQGPGVPSYYENGLSKGEGRTGNDVLSIRSIKGEEIESSDFGTLRKSISANSYAGKRIRFSAWLKADEADAAAGLWLRVENKDYMLAFDNTDNRMATGAKGWLKREAVLDVPQGAESIVYGLYLTGKGQMWADDILLEEVGKQVAVTGKEMNRRLPATEEKTCYHGYGYVMPHNKVAHVEFVSRQIHKQ
ncbi:MAG: hypothetical protein IT247_01905 [Bacteroidia bacterium]|nr:hypothetical protein [Bacteroidia bacterium]